jgi:hypothetical protein
MRRDDAMLKSKQRNKEYEKKSHQTTEKKKPQICILSLSFSSFIFISFFANLLLLLVDELLKLEMDRD